ncbi:MAG: acetyl-CoA carboxylase biotin carboxylase subunit [Thermoprotei archaeon]|nr:MAG: acetyl-CoA carboxylase biotin carboxylase subunit [Thermoprotei archaeon]
METFSKILVANRGEIAVRIIRTAREMGIKTVAIYSKVDHDSLHRYLADEAYYIGEADPSESYLNIEKIITIAKQSDSEAIHPGYGFLSQNPCFVKRCEEEGIVFIGPPSRIHELVGNKLEARKIARKANVPIVKGSEVAITTASEALEEAERIGYPVISKPILGGGGIGMRVYWNEADILSYFDRMSKLAEYAFGASGMYIEKYFPNARHIEVQILGLGSKQVHLYERECSIQRRFQKIVEEAPSPALNSRTRKKVIEYALRIASELRYINAGTIEFIYVPTEEEFYFIEVNSRIQVEHPVTEMITGIDIVREQINIAYSGELSFDPLDIIIRGHAVEARVIAEDPLRNFAPSSGLITEYIQPGGQGVRVDSGVYAGYKVPVEYDPLIVKLITWAESRELCVKRMKRALNEFIIGGIVTNIPLLLSIIEDEDFKKGDININFLQNKDFRERIEFYTKNMIRIPVRMQKEKREEPTISAWRLSSRIMYRGAPYED